MSEFLLELFCEEIPARMQKGASEQLQTKFKEELAALKLVCSCIKTYVTPRRLTIIVQGLPKEVSSVETEKRGPRIGAPQGAIDGFCKGARVNTEDLVARDGFYFAYTKSESGKVSDLLKQLVEKILDGFLWSKSMRWGAYAEQWVRPLQGILCLFDGEAIPVHFGHIRASTITFGHRFLSDGKPISVKDAQDYVTKLRAAKVMLDQEERRAFIECEARLTANKSSLTVKPDAALLEEVTGLVEWPVIIMGGFEAKYLALPQEVPTMVMRTHQKYFALLQKNGALAPHFITIANMSASDGGKAIQSGNERVLRARLADGQFFYDQDLKTPLTSHAEGLSGMVFHAKLGSVADKVERIKMLAAALAEYIPSAEKTQVTRAAMLCKADLTTGMVGEFPELQGLMGRYYALAQGETPQVADAIRDHYKPLGPKDDCPHAPTSVVIALADKLDTLAGLFAAGEKPTGSKDPFALRRAALGVIRLILENELRLPLHLFLGNAPSELLEFFAGRLQVLLREEGIAQDRIKAVFGLGEDDLLHVVLRVRALDGFLKTDDGSNLLAAYKRAANITRIAEEKGQMIAQTPDAQLLQQAEEKALFEAIATVQPLVESALSTQDYASAMTGLAKLRVPLDAFFDHVIVHAEDPALKVNRLSLLLSIRTLFQQIADFSALES